MKTKFSVILSTLIVMSFIVPAFAATAGAAASTVEGKEKVGFDSATGSMGFHAVGHPSALKINGTGTGPKGSLIWNSAGQVIGDLILDMTSLDSGIGMRTNHMKEKYLEVEKFPTAKLTLTDVSLPSADFGKDFSESNVPFKGNLFLHGVTKPVTGTAKIEQSGKTMTVHAEFAVKISDYAIAVPVFAGITVADDVSLVIDSKAAVSPPPGEQ